MKSVNTTTMKGIGEPYPPKGKNEEVSDGVCDLLSINKRIQHLLVININYVEIRYVP